MSDDVQDQLLENVRLAVTTGDPSRLGIDYWDRGGPPGQGYESDLLTARPEATTLRRARFDATYAPPFRVEEYTESGDDDLRRALLVSALAAFEKTYSEETPLPVAGLTKISIKVYVTPPAGAPVNEPPPEITKTFFARVPDELAPLARLVNDRTKGLLTRPVNILSTKSP